ncbi:MAG: sulfotransferase [Deltaproteobacteria bacterium]|nr:sulfotransferase [Deltaproteobacteria bacterium]
MPRPFFIVGAPRTGTTLLRRVLVAHPAIAIPPESFFIAEYLEAEHVPLERRLALWLKDPELLEWGEPFATDDFTDCPDMAAIVRRTHELFAERRGAEIWGQKTPRLVRSWERLATLYPDAVFIHPTRDPRAVVSSLQRSPAHQLNPLMGARRWRDDTAMGLAMEEHLGERVFRYDYEALARDPEGIARRVCDHLDLPFDPVMLAKPTEKLELKASEERAGHHTETARPIHAESVERWRDDLSDEERAVVAHVTHEVARRAGYELPDVAPPSAGTRFRMTARHGWTSVRKALRDVSTTPEILELARRHAALGSLRRMIGEAFASGRSRRPIG